MLFDGDFEAAVGEGILTDWSRFWLRAMMQDMFWSNNRKWDTITYNT